LIAFFGNYLINNVAAAIASLVPAGASGSFLTPQYFTYVICAAIIAGLMTWWYFAPLSRRNALMNGVIFGVSAFVIAIATTFVSGVAGLLTQTGSLAQVANVLPNFGPFLMSWATLFLLGFWVIPSALVGWYLQMRMNKMTPAAMPEPMMSSSSM